MGRGLFLTQLTSLALAQFATHALVHDEVKAVAKSLQGDVLYNLGDEGRLEQQTGLAERYATLAHVEQCLVVHLPHGASVRALDIVGIDLQHGLGVHACLACGAQVGPSLDTVIPNVSEITSIHLCRVRLDRSIPSLISSFSFHF